MKTHKQKVEEFKDVLHKGMIKNFENDGYITPVVFFFKGDQPMISTIPSELLNTPEGKLVLADIIKTACLNPETSVAGIIIEAYGAKINEDDDSEKAKSLLKGEIRVSELDEKQDIIIMIFSTIEGEETISYIVDPKTKTITEPFQSEGADQIAGTFSDFFKWKGN